MKRIITDYRILEHWEPGVLQNMVTNHVRSGWKIAGGVAVHYNKYYQAVYQEAEVEDE